MKSPNWHRRVRARRSRARHRVHRWVLQPRTSTLGLVRAAVDLLEKHHSQPTYTTIRRMPQWWDKPRYWKGSWGAGSGGKGKGQSPKPKGGGKKKDEKEQDIAFPAYDALPSSSASTASSGSQDTDLRQIVKALVQSSAVSLPEEAKKFLEQEEASDFRQELKKTQTQLNRRRKAHGKLLRLRETLSEKHNQYNLFREKMKEQLLSQQQKYEEDVKSLEKAILDAEQALLEIKSDEEKEDPNGPAPMETPELEDILQIDADKKKVELNLAKELEQSKQETAATKKMFNLQSLQLQTYMQKVEQMQLQLDARVSPTGPTSEVLAPVKSPAVSPQMAKTLIIPPRGGPYTRGPAQNPQLMDPLQAYGRGRPEAQVIEDSPPKLQSHEGMD